MPIGPDGDRIVGSVHLSGPVSSNEYLGPPPPPGDPQEWCYGNNVDTLNTSVFLIDNSEAKQSSANRERTLGGGRTIRPPSAFAERVVAVEVFADLPVSVTSTRREIQLVVVRRSSALV